MVDTPFGPPVAEVPLPRPPLTFVVAQARFERIASVVSEDFIGGFQEAIRGSYPVMRRAQQAGMLIGPEGQVVTADAGVLWRFDERPEGWQVVLAPDFVALSTKQYTRRQDFMDRFATILGAAQQELRVRFCERLGIRYVDRVTEASLLDRLPELLKPEVVGAVGVDLGEESVQPVHNFVDATYRLAGTMELHARWGVLPPSVTFDPAIEAAEMPSWVLDLDAYSTGQIAFDPRALTDAATQLTERIYRFFRWAVRDDFLVAHGGRP
ncbi:MAG: TIGR04255 family protein [Candidatus Dormibacteria bacterium]